MSARILNSEPLDFSPGALAILQEIGTVDSRETHGAELARAFGEYDVVWIRLANRITADMLGPKPRCRVLAVPTTGLDHIDVDACSERGVRVVSLRGEAEFLKNVRGTAELTLALTLALLRQIPAAATSVKDGHWNRDWFRGRELYEKTVGIVGVGRLGTIAAEYFRALGCRVAGYDPRPDFPRTVERVETLPQLLAQSDVVCVMAKYDESTAGLLGRKEFASLKRGSVLVNTARGGIVDEAALLATLESGTLAGAALDVLSGEPNVDATHPLVRYAQSHPNVLIVPHIGGNTFESLEKTETFIARKVVHAWNETAACAH